MANDFSTGDIYKEALRKLGEKREQPITAPNMPFAGLNERGNTAYDALDNEAYVNKALTDRAFGTAGDRMATIKQRRESNLRNTLGKNERQRRNFEQNVDLAIKNYETRQKADETIAAAQYGAAEAAAHVSQSNFEKQLGLKRQRLEMDKKNSEFEHAFKLLSDRKLNEKGFQDITGIKVKKKPRPKPAFNMASVNAIIADANHGAVQSGVAALKENRLQEGYQGSSDTGGNPEIVGMTGSEYLAAHKEEYIEQYGATEFGIAQSYFWGVDTMSSMVEYSDAAEFEAVDFTKTKAFVDFINNADSEISKHGMNYFIETYNEFFSYAQEEISSAWQSIYDNEAERTGSAVSVEFARNYLTDIKIQYDDTPTDRLREKMGLMPESFDYSSIILVENEEEPEYQDHLNSMSWGHLQNMEIIRNHVDNGSDTDTEDASSADDIPTANRLIVPAWYVLPDVITDQCLYDLLAIDAYIDWKTGGSAYFGVPANDQLVILPDDELIQHGASLSAPIEAYNAEVEANNNMELARAAVNDTITSNMAPIVEQSGRGFSGHGGSFSLFDSENITDAYLAWKDKNPEPVASGRGFGDIPDAFYESQEYKDALKLDVLNKETEADLAFDYYTGTGLYVSDDIGLRASASGIGVGVDPAETQRIVDNNVALDSATIQYLQNNEQGNPTIWALIAKYYGNKENLDADALSRFTIDGKSIQEFTKDLIKTYTGYYDPAQWHETGLYIISLGNFGRIDNTEELTDTEKALFEEIRRLVFGQQYAPSEAGESVNWMAYTENADFEEYAQIGTGYISSQFGYDGPRNKVLQYLADYDQEYADWTRQNPGNWGSKLPSVPGATHTGNPNQPLECLTNQEIDLYNYLFAHDVEDGTVLADAYLDAMTPTLLARKRGEIVEWAGALAQRDPVLASLKSITDAPATGAGYVYGLLAGDSYDSNSPWLEAAVRQQVIREEVSEDMDAVGKFFYSTGMSMGDFLISVGVSGGNPGAVLTLMGTSAATSAMLDAESRGASHEKALTYGFLVGAAEAVFERFSLGNLSKITRQAATSLVNNIFQQAGIEASEELATEVADILIDAAVMRENSHYNLAVKQYMTQGMTLEQAEKQASLDIVKQVIIAGAQGGFSGGAMGGGATAISSLTNVSVSTQASQTQASTKTIQPITQQSYTEGITANQNTNIIEQVIVQLSTLDPNTKVSPNVTDAIGHIALVMQNIEKTIPAKVYDNVMTAYRTFEASSTNGNAVTLLNTANQSINHAIAQQQAAGIDTSALTALKAQMESALSEAANIITLQTNKLGSYGRYLNMMNQVQEARESGITAREFAQHQGVASTLTDAEASLGLRNQAGVAEHAMGNAISTLLKLPVNLQTQANVEGARQAYFDYLTAKPGSKTATYDEAIRLLGESINAALENSSLDAETRLALEGMLEEIDNGRSMGDNKKDNYIIYNEMHKESLPVPKGKGPNGGRLQSHHGLQREWAINNLSQYEYDPDLAPTITIETGQGFPHTVITNNQNQRKNERVANGQGKWSSTLQEELHYLINDLLEAGFSREDIEKILEQQYRMLEKLRVKYERIEI